MVYNKNGANSTLESAAFGAWRIVKTSTGYDVRYFITDHLGSVRASINQAGQVSDRSDYQLLGERWSGAGIEATTNRYQFNGKECQMVLAAANGAGAGALDGSHLLDYGARNYDPNIGRWFTPDPLSEKYNSMSPYNYCANNPINAIDPDGMDWYSITKKDSNGNEYKEYRYSEEFRSKQKFQESKIEGKYLGLTHSTGDKGKYLSLLGTQLNKTNDDGSMNKIAKMVENIDNAIINYYKSAYLNAQPRGPYDYEQYSSQTNMFVAEMTSRDVAFNRHSQIFYYGGGIVRYWMSSNAKGCFDWGEGMVKNLSGFNDSKINGATAFVEGSGNYKPVAWTFPTTESWRKTKELVVKLMTGRKW